MKVIGRTLVAAAVAVVLLAACDNTLIRSKAQVFAGTTIWREETMVDAGANAGANYSFGGYVDNSSNHAVAVDGDWAIVGSPNDGGSAVGAAYIFQHSSSGWSRAARLTPSDTPAGGGYGVAVAISGDYAVVGAPGANGNGEAYVLKRSGSTWSEIKQLTSNVGGSAASFGFAVAISGGYIAVGDPDYSSSQGRVDFFDKDQGGTDNWGFTGAPASPSLSSGDRFGWAVAIDGELLAVGAYGRSSSRGSVLTYTRSGPTWAFTKELVPAAAAASDEVGYSVAIVSGLGVATGAVGTSTTYFFPQKGTSWSTPTAITAEGGSAGDVFGASVALTSDHLVVGASRYTSSGERGAVYTFLPVGSSWVQRQRFTYKNVTSGSFLGSNPGICVAVSGTSLAAGLPFDDTRGTDAGAAQFYYYGEENR